ncbi:glycoside hydrolase family 26 protein [Arthrobacter sp. EPSL27]|uniref:glycoside hydrolase family 26 protein n=1 Tax=Arthrobacter sp. EPSL27 TaxID=1745378 RepID=UPI0009E81982|nr:glycosyl hydrolase [Arthrobacter sp. EPSL27]
MAAPAQAAAASISLSPAKGPAGTTVTVTGTGFPKKSSGTVSAGTSSAAFKASASGYFTADIVIPQTSQPVLDVQAVSGTVRASTGFTLLAAPAAEPSPPGISSSPLRFGVGTPGGPLAGSELDQVASLAGEAPSVILSYKDFNQAPPITELNAVRSRGATTLLTWEPWAWGGGSEQPAYTLKRISAGNFDPYLREWGTALASWGHPVMLRFGHEMNGNWYPWAEGINGNEPGDFAAAWRHVHDVVAATGATNITWVWNPNVPYWGSTPLDGLYPGSAYVDAVALDGYNWGTSAAWSSWVSPSELFGYGLAELSRLAPGKEVLVAETASAEQGGSKADWNTALISYLAARADVTAVVWFNFNKETDWRINSSTSSAAALASALAAR